MASEYKNDTTIISRVPPKRILVVDDSPEVADTLRAMLETLNHRVEMAANGREALEMFTPDKYDLVVTDYAMPRMNGVELAETIKRRAPQQFVMMVTAYTFTLAAYDGRPLPVDCILNKPFRPRDFNDCLTQLFSGTRTPAVEAEYPATFEM